MDELRSYYAPGYFNRLNTTNQQFLLTLLRDPVIFSKALLGFDPYPYQIPFLYDQSNRIIMRKGRQTGGSKVLSVKTVFQTVWCPDVTYAVVSPSQRQSSLLFKSVMDYFQGHPFLSSLLNGKKAKATQTQIVLPNRSTIYSLPAGFDGRTIRGIAIGVGGALLYDEAAMIPDKAFDAADFSTSTGGAEILNSTPLGEFGHFWNVDQQSTLSKSGNPIYQGYHWPSALNPLITPAYIAEKKLIKSDATFQQEIMGEFVSGYGKWFNRQDVEQCIDYLLAQEPTGDRSKLYVYGIDLGIEHDPTVVTVCEVVNQKFLVVRHIAAFLKNPKDQEYTHIDDYSQVVKYVLDLHHVRGFTCLECNCDASNQSYVSTMLEKGGLNVNPVKFGGAAANGNGMKVDLMTTLQTAFKAKQVKIPNEPSLRRQLNGYCYSITDSHNYVFTRKDEDFIDSLALCVYTLLGDKVGSDNFYVGSAKK